MCLEHLCDFAYAISPHWHHFAWPILSHSLAFSLDVTSFGKLPLIPGSENILYVCYCNTMLFGTCLFTYLCPSLRLYKGGDCDWCVHCSIPGTVPHTQKTLKHLLKNSRIRSMISLFSQVSKVIWLKKNQPAIRSPIFQCHFHYMIIEVTSFPMKWNNNTCFRLYQ